MSVSLTKLKALAKKSGFTDEEFQGKISEAGIDFQRLQEKGLEGLDPEQRSSLLKIISGRSGVTIKSKETITVGGGAARKATVARSQQQGPVTVQVRRRVRYVDPDAVPEEEEAEALEAQQDEMLEEATVEENAEAAPEESAEPAAAEEVVAEAEEAAVPDLEVDAVAEASVEEPTEAPAAPPEDKPASDRKDQRRKGKGKKRQDSFDKDGDDNGFGRKKQRGGKARRITIRRPKQEEHSFTLPTEPVVHEVTIPETIVVADLAKKMKVKAADLIKTMMTMGAMATINQVIDQETAVLVVEEMGHIPKLLKENAIEDSLVIDEEQGEKITRAPVVTIMGHVDHGKTSLLDYIRTSKVTDAEAGGITQHIGAYHVTLERGTICFLDTPGHAAFTAMRARGAKCTDIVILVVAADDGVMPQTIEGIQHAKAAGVPVIVAVNKIDKPEADPDRVKNELSAHDVIPEDWGGDTMFVHVSAKSGEGIDELLESVLIQSEVLELQATIGVPGKGVVIESRVDKGRGTVATVLVQSGEVRKGDIILAGMSYGRVRALLDENGKSVDEAGPSIPVEVLGLSDVPAAGDDVVVVNDEKKAREVALFRQGKFREVKFARQRKSQLDNMFERMAEESNKSLNIVLKADVQGSVEAITDALHKLSQNDITVKVIASGVGGINESDVHLSVASNAMLVGFNVRADATARRLTSEEQIEIQYFSVIYDLIDAVKIALGAMMAPQMKEQILGLAEVKSVFRSSKLGAIAGCMVIEGTIKRNNPIRVLRDNVVIYEGQLESLRRFKDDVESVRHGTECGIGVKDYNDIKEKDQIEVYETIEVKPAVV